jgi:hypothetical protein
MQLAAGIAGSLRGCPGVAGLDPAGRYVTTGVDAMHRGLRVRGGDDATTHIELELVGLVGANLPRAGAEARTRVVATLVRHGHRPGDVTVHFSDIAEHPLNVDVAARDGVADAAGSGSGHDEYAALTAASVPAAEPQPVYCRAIEMPLTDEGDQRVRVIVQVMEPGR